MHMSHAQRFIFSFSCFDVFLYTSVHGARILHVLAAACNRYRECCRDHITNWQKTKPETEQGEGEEEGEFEEEEEEEENVAACGDMQEPTPDQKMNG